MQFTEQLNSVGEHQVTLQGLSGQLEVIITIPDTCDFQYTAFIGHPHSLQGGTMNNKVVTTLARAFKELGIASVRFNFRGVGASEGVYDNGIGESEDMIHLVKEWQKLHPATALIFAGFSFGSYVTYRAAAKTPNRLLISIAPPVHHYDYTEFSPDPHHWIIIQGTDDEVVPEQQVLDFAQQVIPPIPVITFANTTHFFHGKLIELKQKVMECVRTQVLAS